MSNNKKQNICELITELTCLLKEYNRCLEVTPSEFIKSEIYEQEPNETKSYYYESFLQMMRFYSVYEGTVALYKSFHKLRQINKEHVTVLVYVIMNFFHKSSYTTIKIAFKMFSSEEVNRLLQFFTKEDNLIDIAQMACRKYENDFVLEQIMVPLTSCTSSFEWMLKERESERFEREQARVKPPTKPNPPKCATVVKRTPAPPGNTPTLSLSTFKRSHIPRSMYNKTSKIEEKLEACKTENRENARQLYLEAQKNSFKCARELTKFVSKTTAADSETQSVVPTSSVTFKHKSVPPFKPVFVKSNNTTLLREAALISKDQQKEIEKIENIVSGGFDINIAQAIEEEIRKDEEARQLQEIEKKHLKGLLTYEQSLLAKKKLLKTNKLKMEKFQEERLELLKEIERWREEEEKKIRELVEQAKSIEKGAKDAERKMIAEKRQNAALLDAENKSLLQQAYMERERELQERAQLIQELRSLQQVRILHVKEFDPTETPNLGLLCEMSIAELKERLSIMRMELKEELENKRKRISEEKHRQQQMIESVKLYIKDARFVKLKKKKKKRIVHLELTPELIALRTKLQEARKANRLGQSIVVG
ncbi:cilia- and flagella-associated protein 99-like [Agrilus planipennis]|uniref:Cilia- and flagella-associated protein 99-like n=1 Tax=Agrilus planipennis TaxID=224129 RepID=A0A1W4X0L1_AGRPL|nr:cilia- and flagella-associated protein 99-like [Agrilus planipennis]